jgi:hypothetical protein
LNRNQKQFKIERTNSSTNLGNYSQALKEQPSLLDKVSFNEKSAPNSTRLPKENSGKDSPEKQEASEKESSNQELIKPENLFDNKSTRSFGSNFTQNSSLSNFGNMPSEVKVAKPPFNGPSKNDIKRILSEYDQFSRIDPKKILRWPIEIWISCGESFIQPKLVSKYENQKMTQRELVDKAEHELEKQTHALRQMTGRRLTSMKTGQYKPIKNPDFPVVKEGHWSEVTYEEQVKQTEVNQLKVY